MKIDDKETKSEKNADNSKPVFNKHTLNLPVKSSDQLTALKR